MARSRTYIATPPGATIKEQLDDMDMSQKEFAIRMDMSEKHISHLINGDVQLTPEVAMRLEMVLGVPARFWSNLEAIYREKLIKVEAENTMDIEVELIKKLPYKEMAEFGWVPKTRDSHEKVFNTRKYFGVTSLPLIEHQQVMGIACRRLEVTEKSDLALMAWAQKAKLLAREMNTAPINLRGLGKAVPEVRSMTVKKPNEFCPRLVELLASCGVALIFLPHLNGSFLQGATFADGRKIVVGLTARGKDADKFWFSLFHELAHIILGHVGQVGGTSEQDEKQADAWAGEALICIEDFNRFRSRGDYSERGVRSFADEQGIAPGIVVGRMQRERLIRYAELNHLKEQYVITV